MQNRAPINARAALTCAPALLVFVLLFLAVFLMLLVVLGLNPTAGDP